MKDLVISSKRIHQEGIVLLLSFGISFLINLFSIVHFDRPWVELFSQIGYVFVISIVIYFLLWILRLIAIGVKRLIGKKR